MTIGWENLQKHQKNSDLEVTCVQSVQESLKIFDEILCKEIRRNALEHQFRRDRHMDDRKMLFLSVQAQITWARTFVGKFTKAFRQHIVLELINRN